MEHEITKLSHDVEGITLAKNVAGRRRRTSLFEPKERTETRFKDHGFAVVTHADYPTRGRSRSLPADVEGQRSSPSGFVREAIRGIIKRVLETELNGRRYVASQCPGLTRQIVNTLRVKATALELENYKFICTCLITKRLKSLPTVQSGCAWDENRASIEKDGFAEYAYKSDDIVAVGSVYGVYKEKRSARGKARRNTKELIYPPILE